jgi:peptidoglycan-associated lipoprotein
MAMLSRGSAGASRHLEEPDSMTKISVGLCFATLSAALMLAGCSTPKPAANEAPPVASAPSNTGPSSTVVPGSAEDLRVNVGDTVHFAFNEYNIEDNDKATLQRQAAWLQRYPAIRVTVEGDCDERGTREYNLALGARRANAVKEYLVSLGVSSARVETISYGKEHPVCSESTEDCWAQNRRGVTTITGGANS